MLIPVIAAFDYRKFRKKHPQEEAALRAREAAEYAALRAKFHNDNWHKEELTTMSQDRNQGSTRGLSVYALGGAQGKPRVYVTCYPEDMDRYGKGLIHDLANMMDCAVFYTEDMSEEMPEDVYELLSREAYKTQCRTIGENHRWTLTTLSNIGYLLEKQNKMWRARRVYEKVYEACRSAFGESDPDTRAARESIRKLKG